MTLGSAFDGGDSNVIYNTFCKNSVKNRIYERKRSAQIKLQND